MGTRVRFGGAAGVAAAVTLLLLAGGAAAGRTTKKEPPKPPQQAPTSTGLLSTTSTGGSGTAKGGKSTNRFSGFQAKYGWMWSQCDTSTVSHVTYKGTTLTRDGLDNGGGIMSYSAVDPTKATDLADAVRDSDGSTFPWALRSGNLT